MQNTYSKILLENLYFYKNEVEIQNLNIISSFELIINNLICQQNNEIDFSAGGCLRTINGNLRNLTNISIIDCFSSSTTFGVKIIDDANLETDMKADDKQKIFIQNCDFINNILFYLNYFEAGGALFFETSIEIYLRQSLFYVIFFNTIFIFFHFFFHLAK